MKTIKWALDAAHSEIHFKVRHLMISNVSGHFKNFDATVETQGHDVTTGKVHFSADIDSISTNNEQRDTHLKANDFFDADNHPKLTFESSSVEKTGEQQYTLHGSLTMRGVSKDISMNVELGGIMQDPWGNTRAGFTVAGKINRKDFGVSFGKVSETGSLLLGDEVSITANVQFVELKEVPAA